MLIEGKWRIRRCCCFDLRTGTTIFGILDFLGGIVAFLTLIACFDENGRTIRGPLWAEYFREAFPFSISSVMKGIFCTIYAIIIVTALGLLYGNLKGITRSMYPWIWVELANIVIFSLGYFVKMIEYFKYDNKQAGFQALFQVVAVPVLGLLIVQVVRCRMVEIEERDRPTIPFTQVYPNAPPAYGQTKTDEE